MKIAYIHWCECSSLILSNSPFSVYPKDISDVAALVFKENPKFFTNFTAIFLSAGQSGVSYWRALVKCPIIM